MNELTVRGIMWKIISRETFITDENTGLGRYAQDGEATYLPTHRLALRNKIARAMNDYPTFAVFGGSVQVGLKSYQVAPA